MILKILIQIDYVEVDATFNLNGGMLTKADFEDVDPDESLMITTKK